MLVLGMCYKIRRNKTGGKEAMHPAFLVNSGEDILKKLLHLFLFLVFKGTGKKDDLGVFQTIYAF